jgi:hypothetical protein
VSRVRSRKISASVVVNRPVADVWRILTDYNNLATHVPNLVTSRVIDTPWIPRASYALGSGRRLPAASLRLYQEGAQKIMGFDFRASVTMDMSEVRSGLCGGFGSESALEPHSERPTASAPLAPRRGFGARLSVSGVARKVTTGKLTGRGFFVSPGVGTVGSPAAADPVQAGRVPVFQRVRRGVDRGGRGRGRAHAARLRGVHPPQRAGSRHGPRVAHQGPDRSLGACSLLRPRFS